MGDMDQGVFMQTLRSTIVDTVKEEIKPLTEKVDGLSRTVQEHSNQLASLRKQCDEALSIAKSKGGSGSDAGSSGMPSAFKPTFFTINNCSTHAERRTFRQRTEG